MCIVQGMATDIGALSASDAPRNPVTVITLDSRALQVLAHPLRSRLLSALRTGGAATATALAATLETNTGATSYHLRKLAEVGLVAETGEGRGRERWWQAATEMHSWTERVVVDDPDGRAATDWLRRNYFRQFSEWYSTWLDVASSWPLEWQEAAGASDYLITLSASGLREFTAEAQALAERYRQPDTDDPDAEQVQVHLHVFPTSKERR